MERVTYQKSAARKGFEPIQVSRANVAQIIQKGKQEAENLRRYAESDIQESKRQADALNQNYQFESNQAANNFQILQENLRNDIEGARRQAELDQQTQQNLFKNFATLSSNASKAYQDYKVKQDKYQKQADIAEYMSNPEYKAGVDAIFQGMAAENAATEVEAKSEIVAADMVSSDKAGVASMAKAFDQLSIGQRIAYVTDTTRAFPAYIAEAFKDRDAQFVVDGQTYTADQIENDQVLYGKVLSQLRYRFLDENGMMGLSMEALAPGLDQIQRVEAQLFSEAGDRQVTAQKNTALENGTNAILNPNAGIAMGITMPAAVKDILYAFDGDYGKTKAYLFKLLGQRDEANNLVLPKGSAAREALLDYEFGPGKLRLRDNKGLMGDLNRGIVSAEIQDNQRENQQRQIKVQQWWTTSGQASLVAALEAAEGDPVKTQQVINTFNKELATISGGYPVSLPGVQQITSAYLSDAKIARQAEFELRKKTNQLDEPFVNSIADPQQRAAAQKALQEQKIRQYGPNYATDLKELDSLADQLTVVKGVTDKQGDRPFKGLVLRDLTAQYKNEFQYALSQGKTNAEAAEYARSQVLKMVDDSLSNKQGARYTRTIGGGNTVLGFPYLKISGPPVVPAATVAQNVKDPDFANKRNSVLTDVQLKNLSSAYYAEDGSFVFPAVVTRLQQKGVDPIGLINAQIDASNKELPEAQQIRRLEPNSAMQRLQQASPEAQAIFYDFPNLTPTRASRAIVMETGGQETLARSVRLPGSIGGGNITPFPGNVTGTAKQRTVSVGRHLMENGYVAWQHSQFSINEGFVPEGGQRVMQRSYDSPHHHDEALDYPLSHNDAPRLNALYDYLMANKEAFGIRSVLWLVKDHYDHLHVEFDPKITGN